MKRMKYSSYSKYNAKSVEYDGIKFDSKREAKRYAELKLMEKAGLITNLELQKKYILIPTQREPDHVGKRGGLKKGALIEKECAYYADFTYTDSEGNLVVEDTKGMKTKEYLIKRKLMLFVHKIKITEI